MDSIFTSLMTLVMFALYGFILWLFYRLVISVEKIGEGMKEITDLLRRSLPHPGEPPLPPIS